MLMSISARLYFVLFAFIFTSLLLIANQVFSQKQFHEIDFFIQENQRIVIEQSDSVIELNRYVKKLKEPFILHKPFKNLETIQPQSFKENLEEFLISEEFNKLPKELQHSYQKAELALNSLIKTGDLLEKKYQVIDPLLVEKLLDFKMDFANWKSEILASLINQKVADVQINYQHAPKVKWYKKYLESPEFASLPEDMQMLILKLYKPLKKVYNSAANIVLMERDGKYDKATAYYNKKTVKYLKKMDKILALIADKTTQFRDANDALKDNILSRALKDIETISTSFEAFELHLQNRQNALKVEKESTTTKLYFVYTFVIIFIVLIVLIITIMIKSITKSLKLISLFSKEDQGDLTRRLEILSTDEIGSISKMINALIENIHSTVTTVVDTSIHSSTISKSLTSVSNEIKTQINDELADLERIVDSLLTNESKLDISDHTMQTTTSNMLQTQEQVESLKSQVDQITKRIEDGVKEGKEISTQLTDLNQQTDQVREILSIISDIAEQTNLLALNAAIEAARAGEHGRGFAVVSDEIRKLAERTQQSITDIDVTISSVTKSISSTSTAMSKISDHNNDVSVAMVDIQDVMGNTSNLMTDNMDLMKQSSQINSEIVLDSKSVIESINHIHEQGRNSYGILSRVTTAVDDLKENTVELKVELKKFKV
jgi:methyl-accepting chemotaxis protein